MPPKPHSTNMNDQLYTTPLDDGRATVTIPEQCIVFKSTAESLAFRRLMQKAIDGAAASCEQSFGAENAHLMEGAFRV